MLLYELAILTAVVASSAAPSGTISVLDYGARADGRTNNGRAIQAAIDACNGAACTVLFPRSSRNVYRASSFALRSNLTLIVPAGVVVRGTETDADNIVDEASWPVLRWLEAPSMPCNDCSYVTLDLLSPPLRWPKTRRSAKCSSFFSYFHAERPIRVQYLMTSSLLLNQQVRMRRRLRPGEKRVDVRAQRQQRDSLRRRNVARRRSILVVR